MTVSLVQGSIARRATSALLVVFAAALASVPLQARAQRSLEQLYQNDPQEGEGRVQPDATVQPGPRTGADGVEFQTVPLDASVECSSVILKGTRRFLGTAFVLPRVLISMNKSQEQLFEILRLDNDKYLLRFAIYFPRTDEDLELRMADSHVMLKGCNHDAVIEELNRGVREENKKIKTISRVPISSVEVRIDGVQAPTVLGGTATSMFNYQGGDHVVEFQLNSRRELEAILQRIQSSIGLGIHLNVKFNARAADGALYADIDLRALAGAVGGALAGRATVSAGELSGIINNEVRKLSADIQSEAGSSDAYASIASNIMQLIMAAVMTDGEYRRNDPWDTIGGGGRYDPIEPPLPGRGRVAAPPAPQLGDGQTLRVAAVLDVLRRRSRMRVNYENVGRSEQQTYSTSILFKGELQDPDVRVFNIANGERAGRQIPNRLAKDAPIHIAAIAEIPETIEWKERTNYYTGRQLRSLKLYEFFPILRNERMRIEDRMLYNGLVGVMKEAPQWSPFQRNYMIWGNTQLYPVHKAHDVRDLEPSVESIRELPLQVSFSRVGARKFKLHELIGENRLWKGEFDDVGGKIIFTPKENLGQMTIQNTERQRTERKTNRWVFQETRTARQTVRTDRAAEGQADLPVERKTVRLQITIGAEAGEVIGVVVPEARSNDDQSIVIPQNQN